MRWLTAEEKAREMATWERRRQQAVSGPGAPDQPILAYVDSINALPGICTVQSCAGHRDHAGTVISGHLWLRLDRDTAKRFRQNALALASEAAVERVSVIFQPWGQEMAELVFRGEGTGELTESMLVVMRFLQSLALTPSGVSG